MAEQAQRDYENKQDLVDEVENLRSQFEEAAADLAQRNQELDDLTQRGTGRHQLVSMGRKQVEPG